jgi:hypothetical protein
MGAPRKNADDTGDMTTKTAATNTAGAMIESCQGRDPDR